MKNARPLFINVFVFVRFEKDLAKLAIFKTCMDLLSLLFVDHWSQTVNLVCVLTNTGLLMSDHKCCSSIVVLLKEQPNLKS